MKKRQFMSLAVLASLSTLTLASCGNTKRNLNVPMGSLDGSDVVAKAGDYELTTEFYYNRLRNKGYDIVTNEIKEILYADEISAIMNIVTHDKTASYAGKDKVLTTISYTGEKVSQDRYEELYTNYVKTLSNSLASGVYSKSSYFEVTSLSTKEKNIAIQKYIDSKAREGYTVTASNLAFHEGTYLNGELNDTIVFEMDKLPEDLLQSMILSLAENLYSQKQLYKVADQQYIKNDDDEDVKNSFYLFKEEAGKGYTDESYDTYKSYYEANYRDLGTYTAIVIQFHSYREAMSFIDNLPNHTISSDKDTALQEYLDLYNDYYSNEGVQTLDSKKFVYSNTKDMDDLSALSSSVKTVLTDTLKDGEFLTEPRNIGGYYSLVYHIDTEYEYVDANGEGDLEWDKLSDAQHEKLVSEIRNTLVWEKGSSYISTAFTEALDDSTEAGTGLEIYDPLFEYKFNNSYADNYELVSKKNSNAVEGKYIFSFNGINYTVEDFYASASSKYASSVITEYFQQKLALEYLDEFVDDDTQETNEDNLTAAIKEFKNGNNSSYPKAIGLETFLLNAYGYTTKQDVIDYYYNGQACVTAYLAQTLYKEWAKNPGDSSDTSTSYQLSDSAITLFNEFLKIGNADYSDIFSINIDHILIYIDYDNDGSNDDPDLFLSKLSAEKQEQFTHDVALLAQAIYTEAVNSNYEGNTKYNILNYIVKQFNKGEELLAQDEIKALLTTEGLEVPEVVTWDYFKSNFNFLLKAEQLSSSSAVTQTSVSNYVVPFANYVKDTYKALSTAETKVDEDYGTFYVVETEGANKGTGNALTAAADASKITSSSLCKTVFGYHMLVVSDYMTKSEKDVFTYKASSDTNSYQKQIQLLLKADEDDSTKNVYAILNGYNEGKDADGNDTSTTALLNQLFIYYVEEKNGKNSSLDSEVDGLLDTLFTSVISVYNSTNFQKLVMLDELNITSTKSDIQAAINVERTTIANQIVEYNITSITGQTEQSDYVTWVDVNNHSIFRKPNHK